MYVIGAYESMYPNKNENKWKDLFIVTVLMFIIVFSILFNYFMGITLNNDNLISCSGRFMEYNNKWRKKIHEEIKHYITVIYIYLQL